MKMKIKKTPEKNVIRLNVTDKSSKKIIRQKGNEKNGESVNTRISKYIFIDQMTRI